MMTDERFANLMAELIAGLEPEAPGRPPRAAGAARTIFFSQTSHYFFSQTNFCQPQGRRSSSSRRFGRSVGPA